MKTAGRVLVVATVVLAVYYVVFWVPFSFIPLPRWLAALISLVIAVYAGRLAWFRFVSFPDKLFSYIFLGALICGAVGFVCGFFGPLIFTPDANQGPLLGIFITGPLGAIVGGVGGFIVWLVNRKKNPGHIR
jgi:hypothetical protein